MVRAIGQAFEVCHKISVAANKGANGHLPTGNETGTVTVAGGDVTPPAPSTPSTPMTSINTNITSKENNNHLTDHQRPSSITGSHPPSTQETIMGGDDRSGQINLMSLEPNANLSSHFGSSLKIIEEKLEMLTSRIVKMEESQDKLINLLLNDKWSSSQSMNLINGLNTFRMLPNSYTFPPPTVNSDHNFNPSQAFHGGSPLNYQTQCSVPTDTSYLSRCLQDSAQSPGNIVNYQHLQHLQQLFSQNGSTSIESGISPGSIGSGTNLIQSLFNSVQPGSIKPSDTVSMTSPGKESVFSSGKYFPSTSLMFYQYPLYFI